MTWAATDALEAPGGLLSTSPAPEDVDGQADVSCGAAKMTLCARCGGRLSNCLVCGNRGRQPGA